MSKEMNAENEAESSIPFIDDDEPEKEERNHPQCNLRITRNYQKKTRRVEMSRILQDAEPMNNRSLSPVAPLARDSENVVSDVSDGEEQREGTRSAAEFELTIKSNNSVIRIQGFDSKPTITLNAGKVTGGMYEFLSREVDKMFDRPECGELAKADKSGSAKQRKENTWKLLTRSLINMRSGRAGKEQRRGSVERYPKMVLLQEPKADEGSHPEMDAGKNVDIENAKSALRMENENIEKSKTELSKGRQHLNEEKRILKEKKETMEDKKSKLEDSKQRDELFIQKKMDILEEEKLCVALEKQLLGAEKVMLNEEMELLHKERDVLQKERTLLGEQKNEAEDGKRKGQNEQEGRKICHDIDDIFKKTLKLCPNARQQEAQRGRTRQENGRQPFEYDDLGYSSVPPYGPYHCPTVYIPLYNRSIPCCPYGNAEFCCGPRSEAPVAHKNSTTQTNASTHSDAQLQTDPAEEKDLDLPLGFLSSFFPRIVVMKSFQEEIPGEDADPKIIEISSPTENAEKEDEGRCGGSDDGRATESELNSEADTEVKSEDQAMREEDEKVAEESQSVFSAEERATEEDETTAEAVKDAHDLTLTNAGFSIYDKITELATERGKSIEEEKDVEEEDGRGQTGYGTEKSPCSTTESKNGVISFTTLGRIRDPGEEAANVKFVTDGKVLVRKSKLWHPSNGGTDRKSEVFQDGEVTFSVFGNENLVFKVQIRGEGSKRETKDAKIGTDGFEIAGGDYAPREGTPERETSPRTGEILKRLGDRLQGGKRQRREFRGREFEFPGLFFIRPLDPGRGFPGDDYAATKDRERRNRESPESVGEYYCEECLTTMRLFEDGNPSVRNAIDKFETIIRLGSYRQPEA